MPGGGALHFFGQFRCWREVLALTQIQQIRNYFPPKNHVLLSNFFSSSNMFFIRLFLANTWEKIRGHGACFLTNCCERWSGWIICSAGTGARYKIRSIHSRSSLFSVVFMCLISPTQKFKLEKSTLNTKEGGKSRFEEILEL